MSDEVRSSHPVWFIALALLTSIALSVPILLYSWETSSVPMITFMYSLLALVPAWSMIIASLGSSVQRKATFLLASLLVLLASFALARAFGAFTTGETVQVMQAAANTEDGASSEVLMNLYRIVVLGNCCVTLVLFVGKRASVFWTMEKPRRA